ncbi:hypothetical protein [Clostridium hydrogenum]|uniref:hypothetical protein n=1 Tax=Clostridium hydrogenum TaxID=2855764 RepID=UPI001F3AD89B|nr:hypothetical protein [Clostridium hydrogenum]
MAIVLELIFIAIMLVGLFLLIKDKRHNKYNNISLNPKYKKKAFLIILFTSLIFYIIGYVFKLYFLYPITIKKSGFNISIVSIVLLMIVCSLLTYVFDAIKNKQS